jgi:hypothetical protein
MRPSRTPATIAIVQPEATYSAATFRPNMPKSRTTAISWISGLAIRKESVIPSGTPAETNPMNAGTAEHEQNGVAIPSVAAAALPTPSRRPPRSARVRSMLRNDRRIVIAKMMPARSSAIFVVSYRKNRTDSPARVVRSMPRSVPRTQSHSGASAFTAAAHSTAPASSVATG